MPPVRCKVQQVYCKGYPTLFQKGQVSLVIDLTDCLTQTDITIFYEVSEIVTVLTVTSTSAVSQVLDEQQQTGVLYDLLGRPVVGSSTLKVQGSKLTKGIYICDGKKVVNL